MATIIVTTGLPGGGLEPLRDAGHTVIMPDEVSRKLTREELLAILPDCDAVIACSDFTAQMIHAAPKLKLIANYGAGYDSVDWREAARCGIPVTNIPWTVTQPTAELAVGLMLAVCRRIGELNQMIRKTEPQSMFGYGRYMGSTLEGLTLGIIGAGRIGSRTAGIARAFGMKTIGYSRHGADPQIMEPVSFDQVISRSDVISLHCPLTPETKGLISRETMQRMKHGAVLINTSRGAVVDYDAMCDLIESGHLFGAGIDVYPDEPHVPVRLMTIDRVVLTPHVGSNTLHTREQMTSACCAQIMDVLAGKKPAPIVNGL